MKLLLLLLVLTSPVVLRGQNTTASPPDTSYGDYHESPVSLPLGIGLRIPSYDRVNGLAVPWGPQLNLGDDVLEANALVTYRSNLGRWDPSLEAVVRPGDNNELKLFAGRGTYTNDSWIRSDFANSAASIGVGSDSRNYYRGDRGAARFTRRIATNALTVTPYIGGNIERDWSTGTDEGREHTLTLHVWSRTPGRKQVHEIASLPCAADFKIFRSAGRRSGELRLVVNPHARTHRPAGNPQLQSEFFFAALQKLYSHSPAPRILRLLRQFCFLTSQLRRQRTAAVEIHPNRTR